MEISGSLCCAYRVGSLATGESENCGEMQLRKNSERRRVSLNYSE
jgi:hypothetical protein